MILIPYPKLLRQVQYVIQALVIYLFAWVREGTLEVRQVSTCLFCFGIFFPLESPELNMLSIVELETIIRVHTEMSMLALEFSNLCIKLRLHSNLLVSI